MPTGPSEQSPNIRFAPASTLPVSASPENAVNPGIGYRWGTLAAATGFRSNPLAAGSNPAGGVVVNSVVETITHARMKPTPAMAYLFRAAEAMAA